MGYTLFFYKQPVLTNEISNGKLLSNFQGSNLFFNRQQEKLQTKEKWSFSFVINEK